MFGGLSHFETPEAARHQSGMLPSDDHDIMMQCTALACDDHLAIDENRDLVPV